MSHKIRFVAPGLMSIALVTAAFASSGEASSGSSSESMPPSSDGSAVVDASPSGLSLEDFAKSFAESQGISLEESTKALEITGPLLSFVSDNSGNPSFGSLWVTYDGGISVHVRAAQDGLEDAVRRLEKEIGLEVRMSNGGAAHGDLMAIARLIYDEQLDVGYQLNERDGTIDVLAGHDDLQRALSDASMPREIVRQIESAPTELGTRHAPSAGDGVRYASNGWSPPICTSGFMYEGPGFDGYATAGHCPNTYSYVYGNYTPNSTAMRSESCAGLDIQLKDFQAGSAAGTSVIRDPQLPAYLTYVPIWAIAGGYYTGQPAVMVGNYTNPVVGAGAVTGWGNGSFAPAGDCPAGSAGPLQTNLPTQSGDSGGPVALLWNNQWYLASTHIGRIGSTSYGTWVNWIGVPGGGHICTVSNPCS